MIELLLNAESPLALGLLDQAERTYRTVLEADPRNGIAAVGLSRVALERGDEAGAHALAQAALEIDPENATARRMIDRLEEVARSGTPATRRSAASHRADPPASSTDAAPAPPARAAEHGRSRAPRAPAAHLPEILMRVLVTGGAGYVGSVSVEALVAAGHDVIVLDDLSKGHREAVAPGPASSRAATATPPPRARSSRDPVDAVLHCAARSLVGESMANPALYYRENVAGGVVLLEALREAGVGASSSARPRPSTEPRPPSRSARTPSSRPSTPTARRSGRSRARFAGTPAPTASGASASATSTSPGLRPATARSTTRRRTSSPTSWRPSRGAAR